MMEYYSWKNLNVQVKGRTSSDLEQQKKEPRAECHPNRSAELFSPPLSGFSAASGRELLPFVISSKICRVFAEKISTMFFLFLQVARG